MKDTWFNIPYADKDMEGVRQVAISKLKQMKKDVFEIVVSEQCKNPDEAIFQTRIINKLHKFWE